MSNMMFSSHIDSDGINTCITSGLRANIKNIHDVTESNGCQQNPPIIQNYTEAIACRDTTPHPLHVNVNQLLCTMDVTDV